MSTLFRYTGYGLVIDSELELPELPAVLSSDGSPDVVIRLGSIPRAQRTTTLHEELAVNIVGAAYLIRGGNEIVVDPRPHADPQSVRVVLLGRVMGFLFRQRGWLPLHASGVVFQNSGVSKSCALFLGASGAGKSTIAAAFHKAGHLIITDDVGAARIGPHGACIVQPSWSYVRLCEDARATLGDMGMRPGQLQADKHRYDLGSGKLASSYELTCAYILEWGDSMEIELIKSMQAIAMLSKYSLVRHRTMERAAIERHMKDCACIARAVQVRRLIRPRSLEALPELVRLVEMDMAQPKVGEC